MKYINVFVLVATFVSFVYGREEDYFRRLDAIKPEEDCNSAGGICTFARDCPQLVPQSGLCPLQRSQGVECCYGVSNRETRCNRLGGECSTANCRKTSDRATDCNSDERCCILL